MSTFRIEQYWHVILPAFDLSAEALARRAGLPVGIFADDPVLIDVTAWSSLWNAFEAEIDRPNLALQIGQNITLDMFDPALFAAMCSENFKQAVRRFQRYKPLMGPCRLSIESSGAFAVSCHVDGLSQPPRLWGITELVVWVSLARHLTRLPIVPIRVEIPVEVDAAKAFETYFGVALNHGPSYKVAFKNEDVEQPILTTDASMWEFFKPVLEKR
ncbi:MAG: AraC family transcriptional regulator ligand-binding domain-containing protein, partial [Halieaceae bacterium]|nr:AraC family transcriptional regulator ligand-binding domain-containing protein [Halieaceae bacterium]